ncbi:Abi family protein [Shewanella sp. DNRA4]|uniref:Abi family protein n=1 Tax=Shewanella sp. DNRA4 TaxID=2723055 RepID=UPI00146ACE40|nr:Abi family protein [Shewanella sp. DNRA4]NMD51502.1 Abi family protein [Shewanella sp. DNRA4]
MPVASIIKTLSIPRLSTYKKPNLCDASDEQSLGLYVWNKQLSGLFYPVLQVLEVSLRNAINNAYIEYNENSIKANFPEPDWITEITKIDPFWFRSSYTLQNNRPAFQQIKKAEADLNREGKAITPDNLIAKLTFGFWVHLTDRNHRSSQAPANPPIIELWPKLNSLVFPYAKDLNGTPLSINHISANLFQINILRNRIAHHEPIWNATDLFDSDDSINTVLAHYELCLKIIRWINPNNLKLLSVIENDKLMGIACSQHTLWRSKMLASGLPSVPDIIEWKERHEINTRRQGEVVKVEPSYAIILCKKTHQVFYTNQGMQKRRKAWPLPVGIDVTFIPKPATAQGNHPNATQVKQ